MSQVTPNTIAAHELEYKKFKYSHPTYRHRRVIPITGSSTIVPLASKIVSTLELPSGVLANFHESYINFSYTIEAPNAATHYQIWQDTYGLIDALSVYDEFGTYLARIENLQNYIKTVGKKSMTLTNMLTREGEVQPIYPCNEAAAENKRPQFAANSGNQESKVSFLESKYIEGRTVAANGTVTYHVRMLLSDIIDAGVLPLKRDIPLTKKMMMNITFGNAIKAAYTSTAVDDPFAGAADITTEIKVNDLRLMLAIETNKDVVSTVMTKVAKEGISMWVPYVSSFKFPRSGNNQAITQTFTVEQGHRLQKIIHAVYNAAESKHTAYDCSNINGSKISSYRTSLDSDPRQDFSVNCTQHEDYMLNKRFIDGSSLLNRNVYQYNWFHCDDFTEFPGPGDNPLPVPKENCEAGIDLTGEEIRLKGGFVSWTSEMEIPGANEAETRRNHYVWMIGQKLLTIRGTEYTCK